MGVASVVPPPRRLLDAALESARVPGAECDRHPGRRTVGKGERESQQHREGQEPARHTVDGDQHGERHQCHHPVPSERSQPSVWCWQEPTERGPGGHGGHDRHQDRKESNQPAADRPALPTSGDGSLPNAPFVAVLPCHWHHPP